MPTYTNVVCWQPSAAEQRSQEQTRVLQMELDKEREAGAAQAARLRNMLEETQGQAAQEEQRLAEKIAQAQKVRIAV